MGIPRVDVLGVGISVLTMDLAVDEIARWIDAREQHYVCITGVHGVMESQSDPELLAIHNASGLTTPDGMPMVWSGKWAGAKHMERVYGPDLMLEVCERAAREGWRMYFYGGGDGIPEELAVRLTARFPGLIVAGTHSPPFRALSQDEIEAEIAMINATEPDIVWVGLSTPKQERWMSLRTGRVTAPVFVGVGAAFDMHAGNLRQAPGWMQRSGLEWLFRLVMEPRRLWKRYFTNNPRFVLRILRRPPRIVAAPSSPPTSSTS
jgi:N-acetylglucosaminyldiphosphoundecaprenol N-acetyl-beta-D-mannosaminyltransferase